MRLFLLILTALSGLVLTFLALVMPVHLRAVDPWVLRREMAGARTLPQIAAETASRNLPAAKLLLWTAERMELAGTEDALDSLRAEHENEGQAVRRGGALARLEAESAGRAITAETPVGKALQKRAARQRLGRELGEVSADGPGLQLVLGTRTLTNITTFSPVQSAAGAPLEIAILATAALFDPGHYAGSTDSAAPTGAASAEVSGTLRSPLLEDFEKLAALASLGQRVGELEEHYLNMLTLAQRLSSGQMSAFLLPVPALADLDRIVRFMQEQPEATALVFSAMLASQDGAALAAYLAQFPATAAGDIAEALGQGDRALQFLLAARQPIYRSAWHNGLIGAGFLSPLIRPMAVFAGGAPALALAAKFGLIVVAGFLLALTAKYWRPAPSDRYVLFPRFSLFRRSAFALLFLFLALILGEPYLAQGSAGQTAAPRLAFGILAEATPAAAAAPIQKGSMLDPQTLLAILSFLVLQSLIYAVCLVKLAEIRRQPVPNTTKLKLLENEENLFDGGLYCGLFGTAASLIMLTLGVIRPSLISAYSSTLFGILFVALLKIIHVRPYKRRLILESETESA